MGEIDPTDRDPRAALGLPLTGDTALSAWAHITPFLGPETTAADRAHSLDFALVATGNAAERTTQSAGLRARWAEWFLDPNVLFSGSVTALAEVPLPDGRTLLAVGERDGSIRLLDPRSGEDVCPPLWGHVGPVRALAVATIDGRTLLVSGGGDSTVRRWDPATGLAVGAKWTGHSAVVHAVVPVRLADGRDTVASLGGGLLVWNPETGRPIARFRTSSTGLAPLAAPGGHTRLITRTWQGAQVWDPGTGTTETLVPEVGAFAVVDQPDDRTLVALRVAGGVEVRDPDTGERLWGPVEHDHPARVRGITPVPLEDGRILLATADDRCGVRLWDTATGAAVSERLTGHNGEVECMATVQLPDGSARLVTADHHDVRVWDPAGGPSGLPQTNHRDGVTAVAAVRAGDCTLLAVGRGDGTGHLRDMSSGAWLSPLTARVGDVQSMPGEQANVGCHLGRVLSAAAVTMPDGQTLLATGGADGDVRLWDLLTGRQTGPTLRSGRGGAHDVTAVATEAGRTVVACAPGGQLRLWDPTTGENWRPDQAANLRGLLCLATIAPPGGPTLLAAGAHSGALHVLDTSTGKITTTRHGQSPLHDVAAVPLPDGRVLVATASPDRTVRVWDPLTGNPATPLTGHTNRVFAVTAIPLGDRTLLASGSSDRTVRLWDPVTDEQISRLTVGGKVTGLAVDPAHPGRLAISGPSGVAVVDVVGLGR